MDFLIFQTLNSLVGKNVFLDNLGIFFADRFSYVVFGALFLFLLKNYKKYRPMVLKAVAAGPLAWFGISELIKLLWVRPRPFIENQVNLLLYHEPDGSLPSSHAAFFFAVATIVYSYNKKAGILFFIAGFLIGFSRVFVGIHWPSDVLAGAIVGVFSALIIKKGAKLLFK